MFDIGFWELGLIGVVALLVIGPERLPGVARTAGKWVGSAKRFVHSVQADINLEVSKADELKRLLDEQARIESLHEIIEQAPRDGTHRGPVPRAKPDYVVKAADHDAPSADSTQPAPDAEPKPTANSSAGQQKHD